MTLKNSMLLIVFMALGFTSRAQTAETIVEKYLQAIGGANKWKNIRSSRSTGLFKMSGAEMPFTWMKARPNLYYREIRANGTNIVDAFDGRVAWSAGGNEKPFKITGEEAREAANEFFEEDLIDYASKGYTLEIPSRQLEEIDGTKCYKIILKRKQGDKIYFLDAENFLPICVRTVVTAGPAKGQPLDTFMSDYQQVDGVIMPFYISTKAGGQTIQTFYFHSMELNVPVDRSLFAFPGN